mmetsp:Transcript_9055/g.13907  ORF Transcript_9055/g.13907 Transcript_9055/m.13907 type:complete len:195 (+) Transcript_9055:243-827(+)
MILVTRRGLVESAPSDEEGFTMVDSEEAKNEGEGKEENATEAEADKNSFGDEEVFAMVDNEEVERKRENKKENLTEAEAEKDSSSFERIIENEKGFAKVDNDDNDEGESERENKEENATEAETDKDSSFLKKIIGSASLVMHGMLDRTNESIRSAGDAMKKWDEKHGIAETFNTSVEKSGKQLQAWDEHLLRSV